jgi:hypothetical protein
VTDLEAIEYAVGLLKVAGFEHRYTSMKSEACYYGLPGRDEVIRVAAHAHGHGDRATMPIICRLTFCYRSHYEAGAGLPLHKSWEKVEEMVARTVGYYVLRVMGALPKDAMTRKHEQWRAKRSAGRRAAELSYTP